jgi:hypothetical protein
MQLHGDWPLATFHCRESNGYVNFLILVVAGLLVTSQLHGASQLSAWCLHFISSNYVIFKDKEDFSKLTGENLDYVNQHQWPPLSYE